MTTTAPVAPPPGSTVVEGRRWPPLTGRWLGPVAVAALGGILRLNNLGQPHALVFDETYYAKDALSLLEFGNERSFTGEADAQILAGDGTVDPGWFADTASFIVHPPVGKWIIAVGEWGFGATPFGWRVATAVLGTLTILLLARAVLRMTGSALWGTVAGLLLAIDGIAIVMSRTAVLDGILAFFVVAAFAMLLVDRDWARNGRTSGSWWRPWRLGASVALGLAVGVKWSGLWYLAAFGVLTVLWEVSRRYRSGDGRLRAFVVAAAPAALTMLPIALAVYLASWTGWFLSDDAYNRTWMTGTGAVAALQSLWHYHAEMWNFHNSLSTGHSYQSSAFGWLLQTRPTSFFYESENLTCDSGRCAQAVTALGNPVIWWAATLALLHQMWRWIAHRDWRSGAVLLGVVAGWVPWLVYPDRTIFTFYTVVFVPFLVAALTLSLAAIVDQPSLRRSPDRSSPDRLTPVGRYPQSSSTGRSFGERAFRVGAVTVFLLACIAASWFFYPIWSAQVIEHTAWGARMWLPTWV